MFFWNFKEFQNTSTTIPDILKTDSAQCNRRIWCPGSQNNLGWQLPRHYQVSHAYSKVLADKQNNYLLQFIVMSNFHGLEFLHKR